MIAFLVLGGIGFAAVKLSDGSNTPKASPSPSVQPGVSTDERSKLKDAQTGTSQLQVTTITADSGDITELLIKALRVNGDAVVQGNLTSAGSGTFGGTLTAANFSGNGAALTNVNAGLLGGQSRTYYEGLVGTVSGSVTNLNANAALKNTANTFTANNTFNGNLNVGGVTTLASVNIAAANISSLVLGAPLAVGQGGTGLASIPARGIVYGQGGPTAAVATPASAGQCLVSGSTDIQWGSCGGSSGGVASLNGATGILTISGATAVGTTITLGDASAGAKGIASYNATNFSVTAGAVNTIQNIATTASPTFAGLTLTGALPVASGGTGGTTLLANGVIVGNGTSPATSVVAGGAGLCLVSTVGAPTFAACPGTGGVTSIAGQTGTVTITGASGAGGVITVQDATTGQKGLAQFNSTNFTVTGGTANTIQNIATTSSPTFAAVNTNGINPTTALTIGSTSQSLTLQGSNTAISATSGVNAAALTFVAPTANVTYRLQTAAAGTYDVCSTAGNCVGVGGSVSTSGGSANTIPKYTSANAIGPSLLTDNGTLVTVGGNLSVTGTTSLTGSLSLTTALTLGNGGTGATNGSGARTNLGAAASGSNSDITSLSGLTTALSVVQGGIGATTLTTNGVLLGNGTSPISSLVAGAAGQCLVSTAGAPTFTTCPGSGGVVSIAGQTGVVTITGASGAGNVITIQDATTGQKGLAQFNSTNFTVSGGTANTIQDITTTSSPTFTGINTNTITSSGALTVGATTQAFTIQGNSSSVFTATSGTNKTTVGFTTPTANTTLNFPASVAGTYTVCTTVGNCVGGGGGVTTPGGTTGAIPKFSGSQTLSDSIISDNGTVVTVAGGEVVQGSAGLILGVASTATGKIAFKNSTNANTTTLQSGAAGSNLTFTLPVADGANGECLTTNASGVLSFSPCLSGSGGGSGGVSSLNGLSGALSVANASGSGATITINDASTVAKGIAQFNATNFQAASGTINTIQDIATTASPSFSALSITSTTGLTIGTGTNLGQLALRDGSSAFNVKFQPATLSANRTITVPNATGTLAVSASGNIALDAAGNLTLTGQVPVTGGGTGSGTAAGARTNLGAAASGANADITSATALNSITPSSALTLGSTGQSFTLQGNSSSTITATGGGFTTTVGFTGTPTASQTYNFDRTTSGTFTICTTAGNCTGTGGGVSTGGGTTGKIAKFSGSQTLADSLLSESGSVVTATGTFNATTAIQLGGTSINTSGTLSNVAYLNATNAFSAANSFTAAGTGLTVTNNATIGGTLGVTGTATLSALAVTNNATVGGTLGVSSLLTGSTALFTAANALTLGTTGSANGGITFRSSNASSGTILLQAAVAMGATNRTITLPDDSGTICLSSGNCSGAGATLQTAYNNGNTIITTNARDLAFNLADTATDSNFLVNLQCATCSGNGGRFAVQNSAADVFSISPNSGAALFQPTTNSSSAFNIRDASGGNLFTVDTVSSRIGIGLTGGITPTISGAGLQVQGGIQLTGSTNTGFLNNFTSPLGGTVPSRISVDSETLGAGVGIMSIGLTSSSNTNSRGLLIYDARTNAQALPPLAVVNPNEDNSVGLSWRGSNTTAYVLTQSTATANSAGITVQSGDITATNGYTTGAVTIRSGTNGGGATDVSSGAVTVDAGAKTGSGSAGAVTIAGANASSLALGRTAAAFTLQGTSASTVSATSGANTTTLSFATPTGNRSIVIPNESGTLCLQASSNCGFTAGGSGSYIANATTVQTANFNIQSAGASSIGGIIQGASGQTADVFRVVPGSGSIPINFAIQSNGSAYFQPSTDSTTAFAIKTSLSNNALVVDSVNGRIGINLGGSNVPLATLDMSGGFHINSAGVYTSNATPLGSTLAAKIGLEVASPTAFGQVMGLGISNCANVADTTSNCVGGSSLTPATARGILVSDNRIGASNSAHDPTIGVLNPAETKIFGLSWEGQTNDAYIKSSSSATNFHFRNGSTDLVNIGSSGTGSLGIGVVIPAATLDVLTTSAADIGLQLKGTGSQIGDYLRVADSANNVLAQMTSAGDLKLFGAPSTSGTTTQNSSKLFLTSSYWNGASSTLQAATLQLVQTGAGNTQYYADLTSGLNITSAYTGNVGLKVNGAAGQTADLLQVKANGVGTPVMSVAAAGRATFQNSADSTTAFLVQNSGGVSQLTVDTTNSRMVVGPAAGSTTGTIFVLGNKTSYTGGAQSGDPTGIAGAMYYNSAINSFRCYDIDHWRDCIQSARTSYHYTNDMMGNDADGTFVGIGTGTVAGFDSSSSVTPVSGRPGINALFTGTDTTGQAAFWMSDLNDDNIKLNNGDYWRIEEAVHIPVLSTGAQAYTLRSGFDDGTIADNDGVDGCFFKYSHGINGGKWQGLCIDGGTVSTCDTGTTVAATTWYRLTTVVNASGNSADFKINGTSMCQVTTNIPTGATSAQIRINKSAGTTDTDINLDYVDIEGQFSNSR